MHIAGWKVNIHFIDEYINLTSREEMRKTLDLKLKNLSAEIDESTLQLLAQN